MDKFIKNQVVRMLLVFAILVSMIPLHQNAVLAETKFTVDVLHDNKTTDEVLLMDNEKVVLTSKTDLENAKSYQWQILVGEKEDKWADINGKTDSHIVISYALVSEMVKKDKAYLRCEASNNDITIYSDPVTVRIGYNAKTLNTSVKDTRSLSTFNLARTAYGVMPIDDVDYRNVTICINYIYQHDNSIAFEPTIATIEYGGNFEYVVNCPNIVGYTATRDGVKIEDNKLPLNYSNLTEDVVINVIYEPALVKYQVKYYLQNVNDDYYTLDDKRTRTLYGFTGSQVKDEDCVIDIDGFHESVYDHLTIAADGSTVVEMYYDRVYYLVDFELSGGYGVEPLYVRYGTKLIIEEPERPGYVFQNWKLITPLMAPEQVIANGLDINDGRQMTVPAYGLTYEAVWSNVMVNYSLVIWRENANDNNYSYWGSKVVENGALSGSRIDGYDCIKDADVQLIDEAYFTYNDIKTDKQVFVEGDGSTVVNVYYTRNYYTLNFYAYGKCSIDTTHTHVDSCYDLMCGVPEHSTHTNACLVCGLNEHTHSEDCCIKQNHIHTLDCCNKEDHKHDVSCCIYEEHPTHSDECCNLELNHKHGSTCPIVCTHVHDGDCYYSGSGRTQLATGLPNQHSQAIYNLSTGVQPGYVYRVRYWNSGWKYAFYLYINVNGEDVWYSYNVSNNQTINGLTSGNSLEQKETNINYSSYRVNKYLASTSNCKHTSHDNSCYTCGQIADHTHGDGNCSCDQIIHTHGSECQYDHPEHSHEAGSYTINCNINKCPVGYSHTHGDINTPCSCDKIQHTHTNDCRNCVIHTHTDACKRLICSIDTTHSHTNSCDSNSEESIVYSFKAKYEQDISSLWPTYDFLVKNNAYIYKNNNGEVVRSATNSNKFYSWLKNRTGTNYVTKRITLTEEMCTNDSSMTTKYYASYANYNDYTVYYFFESFDTTSGAIEGVREYRDDTGKWYEVDTRFSQELQISGKLNPKEITGMNDDTAKVDSNNGVQKLYYERNIVGPLSFKNVNDVVKATGSLKFEQPLTEFFFVENADGNYVKNADGTYTKVGDGEGDYSVYEPPFPTGSYEPGSRYFDGWYTTSECYPGTEVDYNTMVMPNNPVEVYAKWTPIVHEVNIYKDSTKSEQIGTTQIISHGHTANGPSYIINGDYVFEGWFYIDENGNERAFLFNNMPVNRSMDIYAKWSSRVVVEYSVYYKYKVLDDYGNVVEIIDIADPTIGSTIAGNNKTFEAKAGDNLYAGYKEGYFPNINSHTIQMVADEDNPNTFTFWYTQVDAVPYMVEYRDKTNGELLAAITPNPKYVLDNRKSVVTETFVQINGYMPDAYQKRLVISTEGEYIDSTNKIIDSNVITFYYTPDTENAYYRIVHYIKNLAGVYEEYRSFEQPDKIGTLITEEVLTISGFEFNPTYTENVSLSTYVNSDNKSVSGSITKDGLLMELYYDRINVDYIVRYVDSATGNSLKPPKVNSGVFGSKVVANAISIPGYKLDSAAAQTITLRSDASENIITFYYSEEYVTINYIPIGRGEVSFGSEMITAVTGEPQGSTAKLYSGSKFIGWYEDAACTIPVDPSWVDTNYKLIPQKTGDLWTNQTYYALFHPLTCDLTINRTDVTEDESQVFVYEIKGNDDFNKDVVIYVTITGNGSKTIKDLVSGSYTITQQNDWSWRYEDSSRTFNHHGSGTTITFNGSANKGWLNGNSIVVENKYGGGH